MLAQMAKIEMSLYTDLFDKMSDICFKKCISSVHDADLSVGEMSCTDRCVVKYLKAQEVVGVRMKGAEEQNMQQSAQAEKMLSKVS
jgi:mitochondrial import inner membrane translocase subunit TIM10